MALQNGSRFKLFAGNSNKELAEGIARRLGLTLGKAVVGKFPNGETRVEILEPVRGEDVYVIQSTSPPANDHLMELMLMIDALRRASARSITAVLPYFGYCKQDKRKTGREPISAKIVATMLATVGIDRLITFDLHAAQIEAFFNIPVDNFPTVSFFTKNFQAKENGGLVVVSPDAGRLKTARKWAGVLGCGMAVVDKYRENPEIAKAAHLMGDVRGKHAILIDDLIDTGGTIAAAAKMLKDNGVKSISICVTHALLTGPAVDRLKETGAEVITTNTIAIPEEKRFDNLVILDIAPLLADVIQKIQGRESLSPLFEPIAF